MYSKVFCLCGGMGVNTEKHIISSVAFIKEHTNQIWKTLENIWQRFVFTFFFTQANNASIKTQECDLEELIETETKSNITCKNEHTIDS